MTMVSNSASLQPGSWPLRDRDEPGSDQVMDQHVDVDEQVFGRQHGDGLDGSAVFDNHLLAAEAFVINATRRDQPT
jgi:hypothetical protein